MPLLETKQLTKRFGGLTAVRTLDFHVNEGEIVSIIGPNGSGKTTFFNLISGLYEPNGGDIIFDDESLVGLRPDQILQKGIARTFQSLRVFTNMTVLDNVMVGYHTRLKAGIISSVLKLPNVKTEEEKTRRAALELLSFFGGELSGPRVYDPVYSLPYADRRRVEICRALAAEPKLLLLDEPAAGMNPNESLELMDQIKQLRDRGYTIVLIEHDMNVVMQASDRVMVMDHGEKIAEGLPHEVAADPHVIEAYLGRKEAHNAKAH